MSPRPPTTSGKLDEPVKGSDCGDVAIGETVAPETVVPAGVCGEAGAFSVFGATGAVVVGDTGAVVVVD
jgi:hypothetical protein